MELFLTIGAICKKCLSKSASNIGRYFVFSMLEKKRCSR